MYSRSQKKSDKRHLFTTLWLIRYSNDAWAASNEYGQIFDLCLVFFLNEDSKQKQGWNDKKLTIFFCTILKL